MIPLYKPYMPDGLSELESILHSGQLSYGNWGKKFEAKLGNYIGEKQILAVNSYNSAMLVALATIGIKPGDEVIASPMSCLASNQPFVNIGAKVIWADIDPKTGTLDPESVQQKITAKTKAIFHNHYCGYLGYIDEINSIGRENGIIVVDDAIEAFGSEYNNKRMGNIGTDITVFSFQTVRLPNTIDGGAIAFKNTEMYKKATLIRDYGIDRSIFRDNLGEISANCDIKLSGFGATPNELNSYIGCKQMDIVDQLIANHRKNASRWKDKCIHELDECYLLGNNPIQSPNYWIFGLLTLNKRDAIVRFRESGHYASGVHLPNNKYSVFGDQKELPGVNEFYSKFVALPCGWWFTL